MTFQINKAKEKRKKMIIFKAKAEIRAPYFEEEIKLEARTVNGVLKPAFAFWKRYYNAEIDGSPCMLRFRDGAKVQKDLKKGDLVDITFNAVEIDNDTSNIFAIECAKGK